MVVNHSAWASTCLDICVMISFWKRRRGVNIFARSAARRPERSLPWESLSRRYLGLIKHTDMGDRCVRNKRERQVVPKPWTPTPPTFNVVCMISFRCQHRCEINANFCARQLPMFINIEGMGAWGSDVIIFGAPSDSRLFRSHRYYLLLMPIAITN